MNLVKLTAREHFICHLLLVKMTVGDNRRKMINAARGMARRKNNHQTERYVPSSRIYEYLKKSMSLSSATKEKISKALLGRKKPPRSKEHSAKLSFKKSEETKRKMSESRIGKSWGHKHSEDTKDKMSAWQKGVPKEHVMCEFCKQSMSKPNYSRWHGVKCKKNT